MLLVNKTLKGKAMIIVKHMSDNPALLYPVCLSHCHVGELSVDILGAHSTLKLRLGSIYAPITLLLAIILLMELFSAEF